MESASQQTTNGIHQSVDISLQTELSSNQSTDLSVFNAKVSEEPLQQSPKCLSSSEPQTKNETKIYMEFQVNYELIEKPKGLFEDKEIRNGFIRKVYGILFVQILFTIIVSGIMFTFLRDWVNIERIQKRNDGLALGIVLGLSIVSTIALMTVLIIFCCSVSARRTVPTNYILLGIFTLAETFLVGFICAQNDGENIIIAFIITGVVVLAITLLATTPWFDITNCWCLLFILLIIHVLMGFALFAFVLITGIQMRLLYLGLSIFGAFLFSMYLLYDTQLILGGKKYQVSPEEYVFAAICLYIDIIQIFLNILGITRNIN